MDILQTRGQLKCVWGTKKIFDQSMLQQRESYHKVSIFAVPKLPSCASKHTSRVLGGGKRGKAASWSSYFAHHSCASLPQLSGAQVRPDKSLASSQQMRDPRAGELFQLLRAPGRRLFPPARTTIKIQTWNDQHMYLTQDDRPVDTTTKEVRFLCAKFGIANLVNK